MSIDKWYIGYATMVYKWQTDRQMELDKREWFTNKNPKNISVFGIFGKKQSTINHREQIYFRKH